MQNAEQNTGSIWNRIKRNDIFLAKDRINREFSVDRFDGIINSVADKDTKKFMEDLRSGGTSIAAHTDEELEHFAYYIYESRKTQSNNSA